MGSSDGAFLMNFPRESLGGSFLGIQVVTRGDRKLGWYKVKGESLNTPLSTLPHWGSQVNVLESACVRDRGQRGGMLTGRR